MKLNFFINNMGVTTSTDFGNSLVGLFAYGASKDFVIPVFVHFRNFLREILIKSFPTHISILSHAPILTYSGASNLLKKVKIGAWVAKSKVVKSVSCVGNYIKPYQYQEKISLNIIIGLDSQTKQDEV